MHALPPDVPPPPVSSSVVILVAEDEPKIRELVQLVLRHRGYAVLAAGDAAQAQALAEPLRDAPALLLTDVVMPGRSGRELCDALRLRWPALPVLFMSGFAGDALAGLPPGPAHTGFLAKPFTPAQLLAQVGELLRGTMTSL